MSTRNGLAALLLAAIALPALPAESHCPGNVDSLPLRFVQRSQIVMAVTVNQAGPFDFVVDTGAQVMTIDPALAAELHLHAQETAGVTGVGVFARAPLTRLDSVAAGSHVVENVWAVVQNLGQTQLADHRVRGVLAGNFLEHFDLLIDYSCKILCLDDSMRMRAAVKGQRIPLSAQPLSPLAAAPQKLIVPAHLSGVGRILLQLDSGTNAPILFNTGERLRHLQSLNASLRTRGTDGQDHAFTPLAGQDLQVGPHLLRQIPFVIPVEAGGIAAKTGVDGLLPTLLFHHIFVDYSDHYVVLEPW